MKLGLVVEGGGMKCAYGAAILDRMLDLKINPDYAIGVSAGSANLASFLAGQRERNLRFYERHMHDKAYFGPISFAKTGSLFNLDFIYSTLSNSDGRDPLDFDAIKRNPSEFKMVATEAQSGLPHYFTKDELYQDDYTCIKASCALPVVCKPIEIDKKQYFDGGVSDAIPVQKALDDGCDKLIVILSKPRSYEKKPEGMKAVYTKLLKKYPQIIIALDNRHIMYKKCFSETFELEKEGKALVFAMSREMKMSTYSMDEFNNLKLYAMGLSDFEAKKDELLSFIKE
ncbi:MAG: patatin family protein [Eubacterium sp.]|nr:patatin family protein [Eubacterium sp.]